MSKIKNLLPNYSLEDALEEIEHMTRAYNLVSALHTEAQLENERLHRQLDRMSASWPTALKYWIKNKLGLIRHPDV